jgi:UDP-N-acetylmuramoylalanine--D-glutamate ligase
MKLAILGFGREGKALKAYLQKKYPKQKITILDKKINPDYLKRLGDFDMVFRSPGVPYNLPEIQEAIKKGVRFSSNTKVFFNEVRKAKKRIIIGITGTKGKGTTLSLLFDILKTAKKDVYLAGNIGTPALSILPKLNKKSIAILELSSFQLQGLGESPDIAVILDVFPDHLDIHKNMNEYFEAKREIVKHQEKNDVVFFNSDNKISTLIAARSKAKRIPVSEKRFDLFSPKDLKIAGPHNFKNAVMASEVGLYLGAKPEIIKRVVKKYKGLPYRLELIKEIKVKDKIIKIYNDSASTNPETTAAAIKSFNQPVFLIAGGKDKNLDYQTVRKALQRSSVKEIVLFGENKSKIKKTIRDSGTKIKLSENLTTALSVAFREAKKYIKLDSRKEVEIVFSPGATSFDMFKDYEDRGKQFNVLARKLKI